MNELALFAGAGGGILGGKLLGWRTVCAVEWEPYPASVLIARQNDGCLEPFPIWNNVVTFDGKPWAGRVDVVSGGFPCQDISAAGKGAGIDGERSGMWREMARIVSEVRPRFVFVENSPMLTSRGLGTVLGDLAAMGFDAQWGVLGAGHISAPHIRERIWVLAHTREDGRVCGGLVRNVNKAQGIGADTPFGCGNRIWSEIRQANLSVPQSWQAEPEVDGMADGVACHVDRLAAIGNGQVPRVAATAWRMLGGNQGAGVKA